MKKENNNLSVSLECYRGTNLEKSFIENDLEKGFYKDNAENRGLQRVGQEYGKGSGQGEESNIQPTIEPETDTREVGSRKERQLEVINKHNPAPNQINTWVRSIDDIKTPEEAFKTAFEDGEMYPDFTTDSMQDALDSGEIVIYSSKPIKEGVFVTPSKMNAEEYAGGPRSKVYSKKIKINDVAWIDEGEGQYAPIVDQKNESDLVKSPKDATNDEEPIIKKVKSLKGAEYNVEMNENGRN